MNSIRSRMRLHLLSSFFSKSGTAVVLLIGLFWIVPAGLTLQSIAVLAADVESGEDPESWEAADSSEDGDAVDETWEDYHSTDPAENLQSTDASDPNEASSNDSWMDPSRNEESSSTPDERPAAPPPEDQEWIAAWIADLQESNQRWIQVILSEQRLVAWEGDTQIFSASVSTGREGDWTPTGVYEVQQKFKTAQMQGDGYDIPYVPYVMYFHGSYAIHGTFWHRDFGTPVSRGCINLDDKQAAWLFYWTSVGTPVIVQTRVSS